RRHTVGRRTAAAVQNSGQGGNGGHDAESSAAAPAALEATMIRPTVPEDSAAIMHLTKVTGVFKPIEIEALKEVLDDYFDSNHALGHQCVTDEEHGTILGYAYYAPTPMTDRTWHLFWIAVTKETQAKGVGGKLLRHVEEAIRKAGGRMLLIETSTLPHYE